jgi:peptidoglycan/xylan/chitin deacetylase (PgdA/CDA1 family)
MESNAAEHAYYAPSPIVERALLRWPNGSRLALAIVVSIEFYELQPSPSAFIPPNLPGGFGRGPYPDFRNYTHREYGPRVGLFRLMDLLRDKEVKATAAIDARTAIERPFIVQHCLERGWEIAAHGRAVTDVVSSQMAEAEERNYIAESIAAVGNATGNVPRGWHGAEYGESHRTVQLLAESGIDYVLDWPNDEQPYLMHAGDRRLVALPMAVDLDDVIAHWQHKLTMRRWRQAVIDAVDQLCTDGERNGRVLVLNIHPWLMGQAFRTTYFAEVLDHVRNRPGIWLATAGEIASAYLAQA